MSLQLPTHGYTALSWLCSLPQRKPTALQEAGVAICDALLDYYMPNQAQRERAYRELLSRDCAEGNVMDLPGRLPVARVEGSGAEDANVEVVNAGGEEESNRSHDEVEVEEGDGRDADDDVSEVPCLPPRNAIDSHHVACVTGGFRFYLMPPSAVPRMSECIGFTSRVLHGEKTRSRVCSLTTYQSSCLPNTPALATDSKK